MSRQESRPRRDGWVEPCSVPRADATDNPRHQDEQRCERRSRGICHDPTIMNSFLRIKSHTMRISASSNNSSHHHLIQYAAPTAAHAGKGSHRHGGNRADEHLGRGVVANHGDIERTGVEQRSRLHACRACRLRALSRGRPPPDRWQRRPHWEHRSESALPRCRPTASIRPRTLANCRQTGDRGRRS